MLLLLALTACLEQSVTPVDPVAPPDVPPTPPAGEVAMATRPDGTASARAPVRKAPPPRGELVTTDCFGGFEGGALGGLGTFGKGSGGGGAANGPGLAQGQQERSAKVARRAPAPAPAPAAVATKPAARPDAAPPPPPAPAPAATGLVDGRPGLVGGSAPSPAAEAPAGMPAAVAAPAEVAAAPPPAMPAADKATSNEMKTRVKDTDDAREGEAARARQEEVAKKKVERAWDWGATVWLSNDDSMSLASAQRMLFALKQNVALRTSEIRPHELLNYFSFDSVEPPPGRVFGVLGGAEQVGDTLTVSLAVRGANPEREPLDLTLLVDRSCSMRAEGRMDYTKRGLDLMATNLQEGDRIDLVLFDSSVCTPVQNFVVGRDDLSVLRNTIAQIQPTSGTNLDAGLQTAYALQTARDAAEVHDRNRRVLLVTDALMNEGRVEESLVAQVGTNLEQHDIRLSGVGVGREFNDAVLDKLTENGKGAYVYLGSEAVVDRVFGPGFDSLVRTVAHEVQFALELPPSLAMERFYGEESSTNKADVKPIHYFAGTTQLFLQDLHVREGGVVRGDPVTMRIEYRDAHTGEPQVQELRTTVGALLDGDTHNLHKGQALMAFSDVLLTRSMGGDGCGEPLATYRSRAGAVADDAEVMYVNGLVGGLCGVEMPTVVSRGVQLKLKLDSDQPIANVSLRCGGDARLERLSGSDQVARFEGITPGLCTVELEGTLPMTAEVEVPEAGADLRCLVRGGRVSCS